jgi:asparagine synthase (glutamine-hydrolysing)
MCGICGYVSKQKTDDNLNILNMTSTLASRGPDNLDISICDNTYLGHTRLSIIDLDSGNQPMEKILNNEKYVIVYNGELYNFKEIKETLISLGHSFSTNSDTEVILTAYIEYKEKCLDLFNGIYAFAIYSENDKSLFLARDRLGIKPLFYTFANDGSFVFASEIKAILKYPGIQAKVTKDELCEIFGLGPAHTPGKTFFNDICELISGHFGIFKDDSFITKKYWDLETKPLDDNIYVCINKIRGLVQDSLNKQLVSDVPVCTMLSGGLDSSILTYLANKKNNNLATFSIDFKNNEVNFKGNDYQPTRDSDFVNIMRKVLNTKHTNIYFDNLDLYKSLKDVVIARDAPGMGDVDSSMYVFCKRIKKRKK